MRNCPEAEDHLYSWAANTSLRFMGFRAMYRR